MMTTGIHIEKSGAMDQVRALLREWRRWKASWWPDNGYPRAVPYVDAMHGSRPMDGYDDPEGDDARIFAAEMRVVDGFVEKLSANHRAAINVTYLNEIGPAVWRSGRFPKDHVRRLCDEAEAVLLKNFQREGLIR